MNIEIKKLKNELNKIEYDIRGEYPNRYITNFNNKATNYRVLEDGIQVIGVDKSTDIYFGFKGSEIKLLNDRGAVSIGTDECFILFMNHNISK